jgi:hypothetical protein
LNGWWILTQRITEKHNTKLFCAGFAITRTHAARDLFIIPRSLVLAKQSGARKEGSPKLLSVNNKFGCPTNKHILALSKKIMDRYFYKIIDNIDFVWKIETITDDPYKLNELDFGHYTCNQKQYIGYIFQDIQDIEKRGLFKDYKEINVGAIDDNSCYYDKTIGLLHKDDYWQDLYAVRYVKCLEKMAPILFGDGTAREDSITETDRNLYRRLMTFDKTIGQKIYQTAYDYFKSLWEIDDYYSETNLDTIEKFMPTLALQAVYLWHDKDENINLASISFNPSWDEEHKLNIRLNLDTLEAKPNDN